jgi:hypothetical protein
VDTSEKPRTAPLLISCAHGERPSAVVCCHMIRAKDEIVGFVENRADPNDLQAWCGACEAMFLSEGDKTASFLAFNDMVLVCDICFSKLKARHSGSEPAGDY